LQTPTSNQKTLSIPYIPGRQAKGSKPLARYLPPLAEGIAELWLQSNLPKGSWVIDPFGSSPRLDLEAARSGYRVLVLAHNPILRFILETLATSPSKAELGAALSLLAASRRGEERTELHIKSLYRTHCEHCDKEVIADAFLWERESSGPFARIYHCPYCGDSGERTATEGDIILAARFTEGGLHRARALERIAPLHDPDRVHAEEALSVYPPRAVYALVTLINKLDGLSLPDKDRKYLTALLLSAFDRSNTLWPHPGERERPKQLTIPPQFRENNIWLSLENSLQEWVEDYPAVPLRVWPNNLQSEGGIVLYEGRIKDFANQEDISPDGILTALPRPNQAFWTLSALWSGWLWGQESVGPFKSVLRRRRYDWNWHVTALYAAFSRLKSVLAPQTPIFGLIGEAEPGFTSASLIAGKLADFNLQGVALRAETGGAQISWRQTIGETSAMKASTEDIESLISQAANNHLRERGEPGTYMHVHTSGLLSVVVNAIRTTEINLSPGETLSQVQSAFKPALSYRRGFLRFGGTDKSLETGKWWLREVENGPLPLSDRVEITLVEHLLENPEWDQSDLDRIICQKFPGLLTPSSELIQLILESYGVQDPSRSTTWMLKPQDLPDRRQQDLEGISTLVTEIGRHLGFATRENPTHREQILSYSWLGEDKKMYHRFFITVSAVLGDIIIRTEPIRQPTWVIIPGGRANLIAYKLKNNPHLAQIVDQGWGFIKYRHIRRLAKSDQINRDKIEEQFNLDPLTYSEPQMRML